MPANDNRQTTDETPSPVEVSAEIVRRPAENPGTRWERNFIHQMKRLREARGMTQTDLARDVHAMSFGELKFHQQTVQRIEAGERPVRLNEAHVIARALDASLETMTTSGATGSLEVRFAVDRMRHGASQVASELSESLWSWIEDLEELGVAISNRLPGRPVRPRDLDDIAKWGLAWVQAIIGAVHELGGAWERLRALSGETIPQIEGVEEPWRGLFVGADVIQAFEDWYDWYVDPIKEQDENEFVFADVETELYGGYPEPDGV